MNIDGMAPVCRQVWERAMDGGDVMSDPALGAHVGSCVTCFRTLAELRDAPRIAAALRADAQAPAVSERFWDDLAARTTDAAASAVAATRRRSRLRSPRAVFVYASLAAAAAAVLLVGGRAPVGPRPAAPPMVATAATGADDETADAVVDVSDLDEPALRRLLDLLRVRAPAHVTALAAGDSQEPADAVFDDDGQANDELVELDAPALLRIERSLTGAAL